MIIFDVKCDVREPVTVEDAGGNTVEIPAGRYHLKGLDHLVSLAGGGASVTGMDIRLVREDDGDVAFTLSAEQLAGYISLDKVEVTP